MLVRFNDVSKSFGPFDVLRNVSFDIQPGQKTGLIGPNGSGKTTLLDLFSNPDDRDSGTISRSSDLRVGHLEQIPDLGSATVFETGLETFSELQDIEKGIAELEESIAGRPDDVELLHRYSELQHRFEFKGGYSYRARTEAALFGVGFTRDQLTRQSDSLSGGEQNRLALARLLLADVDLLLLDEPTNHLDIGAIEWLEHHLRDTDKALVLVSHDRFFLDRVANRILDLEHGRVGEYKGNYSAYLLQRAERRAVQEKEWLRQKKFIEQTEGFIQKNLAGQKTKQAQARRNQLERMERIERPTGSKPKVGFAFKTSVRTGRHVVTTRNLAIGYPDARIADSLNLNIERGERWAFCGPNGAGKTTLLRSCIGRLAPLDGDLIWDERVEIGYYDQQLQDLDPGSSVLEEMRSVDSRATDGDLRSFLARFLFRGEDISKRVESLSGGEKSRLTLAKIIYEAPPLLALDEPTNHLDIPSREALEEALLEYPGTMIFVTHDRRLVERIASHILYISPDGVRTFDRFDLFETWLGQKVDQATPEPESDSSVRSETSRSPDVLSKNRRGQIERAVRELESRISTDEEEVREIERVFQDAPVGMEWDETNRRYSELKTEIESLYDELAGRLDELD
jgi:ATP-binding cassette subfamily F protein 3